MSGRTRPEQDLRVEVEKLLLEHETTSTGFIGDLRSERVEASPPIRVSVTLSPDDVLGHFLIIMELGAGGMGTVYKARDTRLDRPVALKVLFDAVVRKPQTRRSLEREAKAISRLNHPHICTLYDIGQDVGIDYLVMEFLAGETIRKRIKRGPYGPDDVIHYGVQIADALAEAHRCGLLHGDLKPSNVMITANGAKVLDFGLARPVDPERAGDLSWLSPATTARQVLGTLPYMAPEQLEGSSDARSDIFSFGALLYEMASGTRAFGGASAVSVIKAVLHGDPAPIQMMRGRSSALGHIIDKCLPKNPENRWQSFEEIGDALKAARGPASRHQVSRGGRPQAVIRSIRRLVVLPFDNLTPDTLEEYLLDGLTDALTGVLSGISQLRVISRASSQQLKTRGIDLEQLSKQFNIDGAIRGSVSGDADRVHVRVEVVRAATGASLWDRTYDCPLEDILQAQNEMAATIAIALQLSLTPADRKRLSADRRHRDREANEAYLRGLYHAGRGTLGAYDAASHIYCLRCRRTRRMGERTPQWLTGMSMPLCSV